MTILVMLQETLLLFLVIGVGAFLSNREIIDSHTTKQLNDVLMKITLPCSLIASGNVTPGTAAKRDLLTIFLVFLVYYAGAILLTEGAARLMKLDRQHRAVFCSVAIFTNKAFIGIPILSALLGGNGGVVYAAITMMAFNIVFFTYGVTLFEEKSRFSWRQFLTPTNLATLVMTLLVVLELQLPAFPQKFFSLMGQVTTPLALLLVGAMLGKSNFLDVLRSRFLLLVSTVRLVVIPLIFLPFLLWMRLPYDQLMVCMVMACCPAATIVSVVAQREGVAPELTSQGVVHSTLLSMATMPFFVWLVNWLLLP